ncbi:MAG: DUF4093 domain-containing protein [Faecalibacterium sp.]
MNKIVTSRTIVVEGRYDAVKLNSITDANLIVIDGFSIYSDKAKQQLLKRLAQKHGLILLLDSDGAGFRMRHYITGLVGEEHVLQVYTPAIKGKEKRKETAGKEGLLGVEGIGTAVLHQLISTALQHDISEPQPTFAQPRQVTYTDLFRWGLSGTEGSAERKIRFLQSLGLPPRISKKELVKVLNTLYTYQELEEKQKAMFG